MVKVVKANTDEAKALSVELQKELKKYKVLLSKLETNIGLLQTGANWNGSNAYEVNQALIGHFDHNKTLLGKLEKCSETLETAIK
jgi:hypothetical protein